MSDVPSGVSAAAFCDRSGEVEVALVLNELREVTFLIVIVSCGSAVIIALPLASSWTAPSSAWKSAKDRVIDCDHVRPETENMLATSLTVTWLPVIRLVKVNAPAYCCPVV
jgi:hypothetical protein